MHRPPGGGLRWWCKHRSSELSLFLSAPLAWRSLICRLGRRQGRLGRLPFKGINPLACPALRCNCLQNRRTRAQPPPVSSLACVRQFFRQFCPSASPQSRSQLILLAWRCSLTRQKPARLVVMRRSLHSVVPFQQIIAFYHYVPKGSCLLTKTAS